jgi:hypothetical protein
MKTILLLICSNIFMTIAWYGHLKYRKALLLTLVVVSCMVASAEYCFQVPANRTGYGEFTAFVGLFRSFGTFSNPQPNPQQAMSCMTSAYFGSPRGLVSCCKTQPR